MSKTIQFLFSALIVWSGCSVQAAEPMERLALLIGNSAYPSNEAFLPNPVNDASDLAAVLAERLNFNVTVERNLTREQMQSSLEQFGEKLRVAGGMGLFYYSGHGMQFQGENYLIPIGAEQALFSPNYDVEQNTIKAREISALLQAAANQVNIIILDACRDNPFQFKGRERRPTGLSQMVVPGGSLMAYAARANEVASDGKGKRNSPYAASLIEQINQNDTLSVMQLFTQVQAATVKKTDGFQAPGFYSELNQDYCLIGECVENSPDLLREIILQTLIHWQPIVATVIAIWVIWLGWRFNWVGGLVAWGRYSAVEQGKAYIADIQAERDRQQAAAKKERRKADRQQAAAEKADMARQQAAAKKERRKADQQAAAEKAEIARQQAAAKKERRKADQQAAAEKAEIARQQAAAKEERRKADQQAAAEEERRKAARQQAAAKRRKVAQHGKLFEFETVTFNANGEIIRRESKPARDQTEDLGNGVTLDMVSIPGGSFMMGSPEDEEERERWGTKETQHQVTIKPFLLAKYEVTQAQWQAVMGNNPSRFKGTNRPVEKVSWNDAIDFCQRLSDMTGKTYRLPSEAEWEYAARAGTTTPFHFGETITTDLANYYGRSTYASAPKGVYREETTNVGSFPPNAFGLYDMHGNLWEWTGSEYDKNYQGKELLSLTSAKASSHLEFRGGSWGSKPWYVRAAYRSGYSDGTRDGSVGFRLARSF